MPKLHVYYPIDETGESYERLRGLGVDITFGDAPREFQAQKPDAKVALPEDTDAAAGIVLPFPREVMAAAPNLRLIANYTVGFDNVDLDAATEQGVLVTHSPTENNWAGVAEGTMAIMLAILKRVQERDKHVKGGGWRDLSLEGTYVGARDIDGYPGLTIGLIGFGRISRRFTELLAPWRVNVVVYDPHGDDETCAKWNARRVDLPTLMRESDVVSVHCNLTPETEGLIGETEIALMKPDAILINTARGPIVDLDALVEALKADRIAAAGLDVYPEEPPDFSHSVFKLGDKVLLLPHMVANNKGSGLQLAVPLVTDNVIKALKGELPEHIVNPDVIPKWQARFGGKSLI